MTSDLIDVASVEQLRGVLRGEVVLPGDAAYDHARTLFNAMIDKRPAVIAQCATVDDVVAALAFARARGLEIAVRGGGHGVAGTALSHGGLVVDLRRMSTVTVDAGARIATVGGGAVMRDLDAAAQRHGLATTGGRVSTTGVGGLALGGGSGWLDRKFGLVSDNLVAVELVTADGRVVRASEDEHPELFWALHGGGGNFGVATSFTLRLHPVGTISAAQLMWEPARAPEVLCAYRDFIATAPDEVGGAIQLHTAPDAPWVAPGLAGRLACTALVTFLGSEAEARDLLDPMLALEPGGQRVLDVPYAELQSMLDDPFGYRNYWSAAYLDAMPDSAIDLFCARATDMIVPSPSAQVLVPLGGAVGRGPSEFPIPWRRAAWHVLPFGMWSAAADDDRARRWVRDLRADMRPWSIDAVYLNFVADEGHERVVAGLGAENYARLARVKGEYDPGNVFHLNHNIAPA